MKSKQEKLANLFINEVPKFGWSRETLLQCAKKQRISTSVLAKLFPSFEYDVLKFIIAQNNIQVEKNYNSFNNSRLKTRDKIKTIMELKFENNSHLKKALPEMLKFLLRPGNILMSIKMISTLFCFRKSNIIEVGNYDDNIHSMIEDFDLIAISICPEDHS